jgi:hypothetical protein
MPAPLTPDSVLAHRPYNGEQYIGNGTMIIASKMRRSDQRDGHAGSGPVDNAAGGGHWLGICSRKATADAKCGDSTCVIAPAPPLGR